VSILDIADPVLASIQIGEVDAEHRKIRHCLKRIQEFQCGTS
jgi:hypothetical protein